VKLNELTQVIQRLLPASQAGASLPSEAGGAKSAPLVFVVDDDGNVREGIRSVLEQGGWTVADYASCEAFLEAYRPGAGACLLIDAYLPGMSGLELLKRLAGHHLPAIMITGSSDVAIAVQAMKAGAADFIEKPAATHVAGLTPRERQIMEMVLAGAPSKNIAVDLGISQRTVENHRASIMKKTGSKSLPALARLALAAAWHADDQPSFDPDLQSRLPGG